MSALLVLSSLQTSVLGYGQRFSPTTPLVGHSAASPLLSVTSELRAPRCLRSSSRFLGERIWLISGQEIVPGLTGYVGASGITCSYILEPTPPLGVRVRGKTVSSLSGLSPVDLSALRDPLLILSIWSELWTSLQRPYANSA